MRNAQQIINQWKEISSELTEDNSELSVDDLTIVEINSLLNYLSDMEQAVKFHAELSKTLHGIEIITGDKDAQVKEGMGMSY